ncbi:MAG: C40 family peptidase [Bacteroidota bacterium]|nr:C40 family peptidase [Bacteroidota bacterium]
MDFGICLQSAVAVRLQPSHHSEMVTQVLFGELFRVIRKDNDWLQILLAYDNYEGWIPARQCTHMDEKEYIRLNNADTPVTLDLVQLISDETRKSVFPILIGSSLPGFNGKQFNVGQEVFSFEGSLTDFSTLENAVTPQERMKGKQQLVEDAMLFLHSPYQWGGRTPFGIDCSGFTQMVYKMKKIRLLRDASQQATHGELLSFISEAEPGDLAFFDDDENNIIHVGIMIDKSHIIHASGKVRIDLIDHQGIYNEESQKYTHKLRMIKRII